MNIFEFMSIHYVITFFALLFLYFLLDKIVCCVFNNKIYKMEYKLRVKNTTSEKKVDKDE